MKNPTVTLEEARQLLLEAHRRACDAIHQAASLPGCTNPENRELRDARVREVLAAGALFQFNQSIYDISREVDTSKQ